MANAQQEFVEHTQTRNILCAHIRHEPDWDESSHQNKYLPINYTPEQLTQFLVSLNFDYDSGYGTQRVFGYIWYTDGTWSERYEYDGSERWSYQAQPIIPPECNPGF